MPRITIPLLFEKVKELRTRPFNYREYLEFADILERNGMKTQSKDLRKEAARKAKDGQDLPPM